MYTRNCTGCGNTFDTDNAQQKRCRKNCARSDPHRSRTQKQRTNDLTFIGVDGEGVGRPDGGHDYVMLSVGDQTIINPDGSHLEWWQVFGFLWEQYLKNKNAAFIGFFLGYDFTQWTKTLPDDVAYQLYDKKAIAKRKPKTSKNPDPFPVYCEGWEFDIMTKRRFRLRRHICVPKKRDTTKCRLCLKDLDWGDRDFVKGENDWSLSDPVTITDVNDIDIVTFWSEFTPVPKVHGWLYICDTGSFWQMSLMSALNPKDWPKPIVTPTEYETLKKGKAERSKVIPYGDISAFEEMRVYNVLENDALARMTRELNRGFVEVGLHIRAREWYGPGRAAQTWLDHMSKEMVEGFTVTRKDIASRVPEYAREAGRKSYYGGWFEQFYHGHIRGNVEEYDINSAYPWVISKLPCLHHGVWNEGIGSPDYTNGTLYILHATVNGSNLVIGAMPWRSRKGRIMRPYRTTGYYWHHEIKMAQQAGLIDTMDVHDYISYTPCDCAPPLAVIADLYQKRLEVGKKSPQGRALKLVYNSSYGKMAQSIGTPKYANSIYASLITAGCRTRILEAIATHPDGADAVAMIATDGIYFTSPHPTLDLDDDALGKWGHETKRNLTQFMPGVYWDDTLREVLIVEKETGTVADKLPSKTRGVNVRDLANCLTELDEKFTVFTGDAMTGEYTWPQLSIPVRFDMVSATQAIARGKWFTAGVVTTDGTRTIIADPTSKRNSHLLYRDERGIRSCVIPVGDVVESADYTKDFGEAMNALNVLFSIDTPDGEFYDTWGMLFKGELE